MRYFCVHNKKFFWVFLCIAFVLVVNGCKDNPTQNKEKLEPFDFLPNNFDIEGWTKALGEGDYVDARDSETLAEIVGENCEVYMSHKFQKGVKQIYEGKIDGANEVLEVRIFDQLSIEHAQKLYHDKKIAPGLNYSLWPDIGNEARIQQIPEDSGTLIDFYYDKFYVRIYISGRWGETEARAVARFFAVDISDKITKIYRP